MKFIEIKDYFIALDKVRHIDFGYGGEDYTIQFQFDTFNNFLLIYFEDESEYEYWLDYLRKKINF